MNLEIQLESILFWKGEPVEIDELSKILSKKPEEIIKSLEILEENLANRGLSLVWNDNKVMLYSAKSTSALIENLTKEELSRDLSKASLEVLTLILYRGPVTKRDIDYVRGVNSSYILRNLLIRGLIERVENPGDARAFLYKSTFELLSFLGINKREELPEFNLVTKEIENFEKQSEVRDISE